VSPTPYLDSLIADTFGKYVRSAGPERLRLGALLDAMLVARLVAHGH
jgi:hypothetical protein